MRIVNLVFALILITLGWPVSAADWYLAETRNFKVYAKDSEESTIAFTRELERLDEVLRIISGVGPASGELPEPAKVVVFRFGETKDMAALAGAPGSGIGGFFIPRASGSFAFVPRRDNLNRSRSNDGRISGINLEPKAILFHEYVHYFMFQHRNAPYPAWYREGFAEIFSTLKLEQDRFVIGDAPTWRSIEIMAVNIDVRKMMDPPKKRDEYYVARTYGHGWLLASLLNFTPERRSQITEYVTLLARGTGRIAAAEQAFGDLSKLENELKAYRTKPAKVLKIPYYNKEEPTVSVRPLREDEEARIDLMIQSKVGVDQKRAAGQLPKARQLVQIYPDSVPVLLAAVEVEFDNRNYEEAEILATRILKIKPDEIDAAIYLAQVALMQSHEDPAKLELARERFIAANRMATEHPIPLHGYYLTYVLEEKSPPDAAKAALESAYQFAPFDPNVRTTLAHMFLVDGETDIAVSLLTPLIQSGEGGRAAERLRDALDKYIEGETEPLLKRLKPKHPAAEPEKEEDENQKS